MTHATLDPGALPDARIQELEDQLRRERSAREGVERGIQALSERVSALQRENAELRARLGIPPV
jgi:chromosome segregation ATPase